MMKKKINNKKKNYDLYEQTQKIRSQSCFKRKTFNKRLSFIDKLSLSNTRENNK